MNVDYLKVAQRRRLNALKVLDRRQPVLPGMKSLKLAPHPDDPKGPPVRERIVYQLQTR